VVLRGGKAAEYGALSGVQLRAGWWLTSDHLLGVEAGGFVFGQETVTRITSSDVNGNPVLKTPFFDTFNQRELGANASFPIDAANVVGGLFGSIAVQNGIRLWGTDLVATTHLHDAAPYHIDLQAGFRYLDLGESLSVVQNFRPLGQPLAGGFLGADLPTNATVSTLDSFGTRNQFWGATLGGRLDWQLMQCVEASLLTRLSVGVVEERSTVNGVSTLFQPGGPPVLATGGVLALPSNIGVQHRSTVAAVPEFSLGLHYQITSCLRATLGYSFLYWSDVVRPGDQIDHNVDSRQIPTGQFFTPGVVATSPGPRFHHTDFWAQGFNFGLDFRF
jgi:hypothetical protein